MEADDAAAKLRNINDAMDEVRLRSLGCRRCTIQEATGDMSSKNLERNRRFYRTLQATADLAEVDPWDLPRRFIMPKKPGSSSLRTHSGYWKEKEDEFTAMRSNGGGEGSSSPFQLAVLPWGYEDPGVLRAQRHQDGLGHPRVQPAR